MFLSSCYVLDNPFDPNGSNYQPGDGQGSSTTTSVSGDGSTTTVPVVTPTSTSTTTTVPFGTGRHEAEASGVVLQGGSPAVRAVTGVQAGYSGFSGDGYVESFYQSARISFTVDVSVADTYNVQIRYAAGPTKPLRDTNLYVNGSYVSMVQFPVTANWWTWDDKQVPIVLNQGINTIEFRNETSNDDLINFDYIQIP